MVDKGKAPDATSSTKIKTSNDEFGDVCLEFLCKHFCHDAWLIDLSAYFHMNPHMEWFYTYEIYDGGHVFLGDDSTYKIIGHGRIKVIFRAARVKNLPSVLWFGQNLVISK